MSDQPGAGVREAVQRKGSLSRTVRAVGWSFFGVRKARDLERDAGELNPVHLVIVGMLVILVNWVIASGVAA